MIEDEHFTLSEFFPRNAVNYFYQEKVFKPAKIQLSFQYP